MFLWVKIFKVSVKDAVFSEKNVKLLENLKNSAAIHVSDSQPVTQDLYRVRARETLEVLKEGMLEERKGVPEMPPSR